MQLANTPAGDPALRQHVRPARRADASAVQHLLRAGVYVHLHVDWRAPGDWLGTPGFLLYDRAWDGETGTARRPPPSSQPVTACLAVGADPPPAAWVRVAAVESAAAFRQAQALLDEILADLDPAITELSWFVTDNWPLHWLTRLGFEETNSVITFHKQGFDAPPLAPPAGLSIRPVEAADYPILAAIEAEAFEPRWRHSPEALRLARQQTISFDVAVIEGEPVGFQFSTAGRGNAHLARMTVRPDQQGRGVGSALLAHALAGYRRRELASITLNTQADNIVSQKLYGRFGFERTGHQFPIWSYASL